MHAPEAPWKWVDITVKKSANPISLAESQIASDKAVVSLANLLKGVKTGTENPEIVSVWVFNQTFQLRSELYQHLVRPCNPGTQNINAQRILEILTKLMVWNKNSPLSDFGKKTLAMYPEIFYADYTRFSKHLISLVENGHYTIMVRVLESKWILGTILRLPGVNKVEILSILIRSLGTEDIWKKYARTLYRDNLVGVRELEYLWLPIPRSSIEVQEIIKNRINSVSTPTGFLSQMKDILTVPIRLPRIGNFSETVRIGKFSNTAIDTKIQF